MGRHARTAALVFFFFFFFFFCGDQSRAFVTSSVQLACALSPLSGISTEITA